jgi:DNA-binding response OmpR family regulator
VAPSTQPYDAARPIHIERSLHIPEARDETKQTLDILVVEDEPAVRDLVEQILRDEGYSVESAADGARALRLLQRGHYRLLLLDLMMPGVDGMDILRALRAEPALRPPAILVFSALHERADVLAALEAGADDYITKPFDIADFALRVTLWLRRTSPVASLNPPGLRVHSLGRFYVEHGAQIRMHQDTRPLKARTLFTYLLSHQKYGVSRTDVLALLWPDTPEDLRATSLRTLLYQLRRLLDLPAQGLTRLHVGSARVALTLGQDDWWDVVEFRAWLAEGERRQKGGDVSRALDAYAAGVALYNGDYLAEDPDARWAGALRAQLREEWLDALSTMARLYESRGERVEQEALLRHALQADPYREVDLRALMNVLAGQGRHGEALMRYCELESLLRTSLHARPAPETQALAARLSTANQEA